MTDPMRDRVIAAVGDVYDVGPEIGRGGMALVYRATDRRLRRPVAIKVLPPELAFRNDVRQRFLREAETAAQLSHPNIVPIYTVDERDGLVYFVMALVDGESLAVRAARGPQPVEEVRRLLREVADALAYAHARGVIHRDIKPDNILLDRESGRAMVTDFGIARAAEADSRLTVTGVAVGTPAYMSPEQALGEREIDGRSDIYSLGVVAYQMLAGELPFKAANTPAMMLKHVSEAPRPLRALRPDTPPALAAAVERALAKRPEDRWPDAGAFRDVLASDLVAAVAWEHPAARVPSRPPRTTAPSPPPPPHPPHVLPADRRWEPPAQSPLAPTAHPPFAELPQLPPPMSHPDWRRYYRVQRRYARERERERFGERPLEERLRIFRRTLVESGVGTFVLAGINFTVTPWFPWFLFPAVGIGARLVRQWSNLWSEGVTWRQVFQRDAAPLPAGERGASGALAAAREADSAAAKANEAAAKMVPREVLAGPYGDAVRRAAADRLAILAIVDGLAKPDRDLLPDVGPTVSALAERVASLAQTLHHLNADVSPDALAQLEARIAEVRNEPETAADRERRLSLLERQHASLRELAERRTRLLGRLESAGIALQNLRLDLLRLRSSGVQAAINDVTSATVQARALSRDIAHVLEAAEEVRRM